MGNSAQMSGTQTARRPVVWRPIGGAQMDLPYLYSISDTQRQICLTDMTKSGTLRHIHLKDMTKSGTLRQILCKYFSVSTGHLRHL